MTPNARKMSGREKSKALNLEKLIKELIAIPSPSGMENEIALYIEQKLTELGLKFRRQMVEKKQNRYNILAEKGNGDKSFLLYGHMDTVRPANGWSKPYIPKKENDRIIGLGAYDMKGGLAAMLLAAEMIKPKSFKLKLVFSVDEEHLSLGCNELVKSDWLNDVNGCIVPEIGPTGKLIGPETVILGRRGRVVYHIIVKGKSVHGSTPNLGINAAEEAALIILSLPRLKLAHHSRLGSGSYCVLGVSCRPRGLSVPDKCEIIIDRHLVPPETEDIALAQMKRLIEKLPLKAKVKVKYPAWPVPFMMPFATPVDHQLVKVVDKVVKEEMGEVKHSYGLSVADEIYIANRAKVPVVIIGPEGGNEHSFGEWVTLRSIKKLSAIITKSVSRYYTI